MQAMLPDKSTARAAGRGNLSSHQRIVRKTCTTTTPSASFPAKERVLDVVCPPAKPLPPKVYALTSHLRDTCHDYSTHGRRCRFLGLVGEAFSMRIASAAPGACNA